MTRACAASRGAWPRSRTGPVPGRRLRHEHRQAADAGAGGTGLTRQSGNVTALDGADFDIYPGDVVALIGDNGAGKSTLVKALSGNLEVDSGTVHFKGEEIVISTPTEASSLGIETVYQDLALAPHLDPVEHMFLGRETMQQGTIQALVAQQPGIIGKDGVEQAINALDKKSTTKKIQTGFTIITKDNMDTTGKAALYKSSC